MDFISEGVVIPSVKKGAPFAWLDNWTQTKLYKSLIIRYPDVEAWTMSDKRWAE